MAGKRSTFIYRKFVGKPTSRATWVVGVLEFRGLEFRDNIKALELLDRFTLNENPSLLVEYFREMARRAYCRFQPLRVSTDYVECSIVGICPPHISRRSRLHTKPRVGRLLLRRRISGGGSDSYFATLANRTAFRWPAPTADSLGAQSHCPV